MGYVTKPYEKIGTNITVEIRDKNINCIVVKPPLYKNGTSNT
jgi:glycine cleavage system aminomethyltransferase T